MVCHAIGFDDIVSSGVPGTMSCNSTAVDIWHTNRYNRGQNMLITAAEEFCMSVAGEKN